MNARLVATAMRLRYPKHSSAQLVTSANLGLMSTQQTKIPIKKIMHAP